ncbi:MAG: hypothetical protein NW224_26180, partial [Leptolyngbyaceae cyanobacterium bins.302]|nr:hypothetical protein [Leptolyngbyaceae cyanobacterium bins.302]
ILIAKVGCTPFDFHGWFNAHYTQTPRLIKTVAPEVKLPLVLEDILMACLEKQPHHRPQTVSEILGVLRSLPGSQAFQSSPRLIQVPDRNTLELELAQLETKVANQNLLTFPAQLENQNILCRPVINPSRLPALWVKLLHEQIQSVQIYQLYNQHYQNFLFCVPPEHPMLLWLTAIYNHQLGCRWFPCFVDLTTKQGKDLIYLMAKVNDYQLLFFDYEAPYGLSYQISRQIDFDNHKIIQQVVIQSQFQQYVGSVPSSTQRLKTKFNALKRNVERQMAVAYEKYRLNT